MGDAHSLLESAKAVLDANDRGGFTVPAGALYPHQWLWDSCFVAIGIRHYDVDRAQNEIMSLLRGQWSNGMLPNIIFTKSNRYNRDASIWRSWISPYAPDHVETSGVTQPPMLAEAIVRIGKSLSLPERRTWYQTVFPNLLAYHTWLYNERDPHGEGLVLLIHPYESGLDNTPPWINQLRLHHRPWWAIAIEKTRLDPAIDWFRRDTKHVPPGQRMSNIEALLYYDVIRRIRRKGYSTEAILTRSHFAVEDLVFNSIFIRANEHLRKIAKTIGATLPDELLKRMELTETAFEKLWDPYSGQFYSRNFITHKLIKEPSIAALMPLYAGCVSKERAAQLVALLKNERIYGAPYPIPSVPVSSNWFEPLKYWQGPTWVNTNWLIIDGLKRYGYHAEAEHVARRTLKLVDKAGFYEYFSPLDGKPGGAENFSWTASLVIDLLYDPPVKQDLAADIPPKAHKNKRHENKVPAN